MHICDIVSNSVDDVALLIEDEVGVDLELLRLSPDLTHNLAIRITTSASRTMSQQVTAGDARMSVSAYVIEDTTLMREKLTTDHARWHQYLRRHH